MPSKRVTANTTAQVIAAEVRNGRHFPKSMYIDNVDGATTNKIIIQDRFIPSITNGVISPSEQTVARYQVQVANGQSLTVSEEQLAGVKCLGALEIISNNIDANCFVSVGYETD